MDKILNDEKLSDLENFWESVPEEMLELKRSQELLNRSWEIWSLRVAAQSAIFQILDRGTKFLLDKPDRIDFALNLNFQLSKIKGWIISGRKLDSETIGLSDSIQTGTCQCFLYPRSSGRWWGNQSIMLNRINSFIEDELLRLVDYSEKKNFCKLIQRSNDHSNHVPC